MPWRLDKINLKLSDDVCLAFLLGILCFIFGYFQIVPYVVGVFHDDGIYISTAKALAEGKGYRLINLPDSPYQTKYPILYPLLMSTIWILFPKFPYNIYIMQLMNLFITSLYWIFLLLSC